MNGFDKTTLVVTLLAVISFVALESEGISSIIVSKKCKQPNSNDQKFCTKLPTDATTDCTQYGGSAAVCSIWRMYEINNFPNGAIDADEGGTKQVQADCWRANNCVLDTATNKCVAGGWANWHQGAKTVSDPGNTCKKKVAESGVEKDVK